MKKDRKKSIWMPVLIAAAVVLLIGAGAVIGINIQRRRAREAGEIVSIEHIAYSPEQLSKDISLLEERYGDLVSSEDGGLSVDGRYIPVFSLGNTEAEHHVLLQSTMHAREYLSTLILMKQVETLCENADKEKIDGIPIRQLLDQVCFHVIPMVNPDGVTVCLKDQNALHDVVHRGILDDCFIKEGLNLGSLYWKLWCANAHGIDLDRNFDADWDKYDSGPITPESENYKGKKAASEPEVQLILQKAEQWDVDAVIGYHTAGGNVLWGYCEGQGSAAERQLRDAVAESAGYQIKKEESLASFCDYFGKIKHIPAISVEMAKGKGTDHYPLGDEVVAPTWEEMKDVLGQIALCMSKMEAGDELEDMSEAMTAQTPDEAVTEQGIRADEAMTEQGSRADEAVTEQDSGADDARTLTGDV